MSAEATDELEFAAPPPFQAIVHNQHSEETQTSTDLRSTVIDAIGKESTEHDAAFAAGRELFVTSMSVMRAKQSWSLRASLLQLFLLLTSLYVFPHRPYTLAWNVFSTIHYIVSLVMYTNADVWIWNNCAVRLFSVQSVPEKGRMVENMLLHSIHTMIRLVLLYQFTLPALFGHNYWAVLGTFGLSYWNLITEWIELVYVARSAPDKTRTTQSFNTKSYLLLMLMVHLDLVLGTEHANANVAVKNIIILRLYCSVAENIKSFADLFQKLSCRSHLLCPLALWVLFQLVCSPESEAVAEEMQLSLLATILLLFNLGFGEQDESEEWFSIFNKILYVCWGVLALSSHVATWCWIPIEVVAEWHRGTLFPGLFSLLLFLSLLKHIFATMIVLLGPLLKDKSVLSGLGSAMNGSELFQSFMSASQRG